jgi:hypothetical protein
MAKLKSSQLQHLLTIDPSGILLKIIREHEDAINNAASQVNASPVGTTEAPPQVSGVSVVPKGGGVHQVTIQDNNPVTRGISYFAEYSLDANFSTFTTVPMGPSRQLDIPAGTGALNWRVYSAYQTSAPSTAVYHDVAVNSTGTTASAAAGIPGTGSGTEPSVQPQGAAGFGFNPNRLPRE